jgi:hypothetical protein
MWYRPYFAGWNNTDSIPDSVVCIHHPEGDIKKISFANNKCQDSSYFDAYTAKCWKIGHWDNGLTEPGSSGSPLFNKYHEVVGQLFGGPSYCGCDDSDKNDYYGKFSVSWATDTFSYLQAKYWLDPDTSNASKLAGFDPGFSNGFSNLYNNESNLILYPNPTSNQIEISTTSEIELIEVLDLLGRNVSSYKLTQRLNKQKVDLSKLESGMYLIKIFTIDKKITIRKVVKSDNN